MSAGAPDSIFRERFRIRASEMGPDARLRLPVLLSRVAEASGATRVLLSRESDGKEVARAVIAAGARAPATWR